ncbi:MAG: MFS transporter, partial [Planctomycetes bacterium]|nr:MFS transporter [Planctomycetota bacterium]
FRLRRREAVRTAGARIGLAETMLVLDANGAYRARQTYRMDNFTEQHLQLALPPGAELWSATVAGLPVKPASVTPPTTPPQVRIPLVKTAAGELDYEVVVKYGGTMDAPGAMSKVDFPLLRSMNISVELSQVRLLLPESYTWFDFSGTMRQTVEAGEFEAGVLSYQTRKLEQLAETVSEGNVYAQMRGATNIGNLKTQMEGYQQQIVGRTGKAVQREIAQQQATLDRAYQQIDRIVGQGQERAAAEVSNNRARLNVLYTQQDNKRSKNVVQGLVDNFAQVPVGETGAADQWFDASWIDRNALQPGPDTDSALSQRGPPLRGSIFGDPAEDPGKLDLEKSRELYKDYANLARRNEVSPSAKPQEIQLGLESKAAAIARAREQDRRAAPEGASRVQRYRAALDRQDLPAQRGGGTRGRPGFGGGGGGRGGAGGGGADESEQLGGIMDLSDERQFFSTEFGWASLDFELPQRGREYRFTTPRGEIEIEARAVSRGWRAALLKLVAVAASLLVIVVAGRLLRRLPTQLTFGVPFFVVTIGAGIAMMLLGFLPILGVLLLVAAVVGFVLGRVRRTAALA